MSNSPSSRTLLAAPPVDPETGTRGTVRAKRLGGGSFRLPSYRWARRRLADALHEAMRHAEVSLRDVAWAIGLHHSTIAEWTSETGSNGIRCDVVLALAASGNPKQRAMALHLAKALVREIESLESATR